ncbi:L-asparaginase [Microbulbifer donghaiensis]|uniref:L-asparaginase n=1 Tax=Microbulbifer donghaiensis TaxID=494016 RepID=A0A1M5I3I1_9GAMM|nr:N(4)-(beta-N-acetylglucosaminyl)-L-asparaginase [Microbulbifer donghaiensis]SHG22875.1 L-asparaginase [Microbulbifer donghaiensis]
MNSKRQFLKYSLLGGLLAQAAVPLQAMSRRRAQANRPIVISTWNHGGPANEAAWELLSRGGRALDAVEAGARVPEADPAVTTVGYGGFPDREGKVTLDACIMDEKQNCGSVAFLQDIRHPISVARKVMEETPHVMLVGEGARRFALEQGFQPENLLTPRAEAAWRDWLREGRYQPVINIENHDTIGILALDSAGDLSGACTTSGAAFKMHGRVGDSPIIGAGLYVDNEVGAATATGMGELMIKTVGCHQVVELMRHGYTPEEACREAVERIARKLPDYRQFQVGFLALDKAGNYGSHCIQPGFNFAVRDQRGARMIDAGSKL